jgi:phage tail sheath protein FI
MYDLTNYQLEKLTQKGFVTFKQSYTRGIVVTDGITMAPSTSSFRRLSVTRIVNSIEEVIRAAVEPFIGKQNHLANRNSMQTAIKSALEKLKGKLIDTYDFKLNIDSANTKLGIVDIDYTIVPIYEIREVRNRITVKDAS